MVSAALSGELNDIDYELDPIFNVYIPKTCPGVPDDILNPRKVWADTTAYEKAARRLAKKFAENFAAKYPDMPENIAKAGPRY